MRLLAALVATIVGLVVFVAHRFQFRVTLGL